MRMHSAARIALLVVSLLAGYLAPLSVSANGVFTEFVVPTHPGRPAGITVGPDSAFWFTELSGNRIGRLSSDGIITEFPLPTPAAGPLAIAVGPDGNLWFTESRTNKVGTITTDGKIAEYVIPVRPDLLAGLGLAGIAAGPDGNIWFAESKADKIGRITLTGIVTGTITEFAAPTSAAEPTDITAGPDGALWFTEVTRNQIGRITTNGTFNEYPVPTAGSMLRGITTGPDSALWFTESLGNKIGRIASDGSIVEYLLPSAGSFTQDITAGRDGNLWFTEMGIPEAGTGNRIGRITPAGVITEFPAPTNLSGPWHITAGPDGNLWFTESFSNSIGRLAPAAVQHDERYFSATSFRVDDDAIWGYFQLRGGVNTFGYPASRSFRLLGFTMQVFQRHVLQVFPDGSVHPLNLLDPNLMPVTTINGSTFPAYDPTIANVAPAPNTPNYGEAVRLQLQSTVPDTFEGEPVQFLQSYLQAAPADAGNLRLLLALEVWGFPTSKPARDPHNPNFIYQRFQRGILHYDATTKVTQGILLADAFKSVLLGQPPADLAAQEQGSLFFRQYCPGRQPGWLCRPGNLPDSDFSYAFERQ